ncbi:MAG: hypothetical protein P8Y60_14065 [Calditrichota bacterium]
MVAVHLVMMRFHLVVNGSYGVVTGKIPIDEIPQVDDKVKVPPVEHVHRLLQFAQRGTIMALTAGFARTILYVRDHPECDLRWRLGMQASRPCAEEQQTEQKHVARDSSTG